MKVLLFILVQLLTTFQHVHLWLIDCTYDNNTSHLEYICHSDKEVSELLNGSISHCNDHFAEIIKRTVHIVTFNGCDYSKLQNELGIYHFKDLRIFNVSSLKIESLSDKIFQNNNRLEHFIASHNHIKEIPTNFFVHTPELMEIDLSYNEIEQLAPEVFNGTCKMKTIQIAHNQMRMLSTQLFLNLVELEVLDVSNNNLTSIESELFVSNKKLQSLNLVNNPLVRLQCELLTTLSSYSLTISFTSLMQLDTNCAIEKKPLKSNVTISSNESIASTLAIANGQFEWVFTKSAFKNISRLDFENSDLKHIPSLLEEASTKLMSLDLSNTFVGALNEETFQKFTNLRSLYLRRLNLSTVQFATILRQTNLKILDLSYNNLKVIDFRLFGRIFQNIYILYLEGNNLTEIDSITHAHLPRLSTLAISKNRFTCQYLVNFLRQWPNLYLINIPSSTQMQMSGVDCIHVNSTTDDTIQYQLVAHEPNCSAFENHLNELYAIKMLLIILITIISIVCLYLFVIYDKCHPARKLYKDWTSTRTVNENISFTHSRLSE